MKLSILSIQFIAMVFGFSAVAESVLPNGILKINGVPTIESFELTAQPSFSKAPPQKFVSVERCSNPQSLLPLLEEGQVCVGYVVGNHAQKYLLLQNDETKHYVRVISQSVDTLIVHKTVIHTGHLVAPHPTRPGYDVEYEIVFEENTPHSVK